jgi:hypothetical protein
MIQFTTIRDLYKEKVVEHEGQQYIENVLVKKNIKVPWVCLTPSHISDIEPFINVNGTLSKTKTVVTYNNAQRIVLTPFEEVVRMVAQHGHSKTIIAGYGTVNT